MKYFALDDIGGGEEIRPAITPGVAVVPMGGRMPITANAPVIPAAPITKPAIAAPPTDKIPLPDFASPASRSKYLQNWSQKYGNLEGRGDTIMKANEIPRGGKDTAKNIAVKAASKYGLDPALLHASAMEEGASGLYKDLSGKDTKGRKPGDFGYQDFFGDKDFPINGDNSFGLNTFADRFPDLVKKGYLPKEFASKFRGEQNAGQWNKNDFKSPEDAMQAKAAILKYHYDDIDSYAKQRKITLSPKARDFFALAEYNGGEGAGHQMLNDYYNNGYLQGDKFLEKRPTSGKGLKESSYGVVSPTNEGLYNHVARRIKMAKNLKEQSIFD